MKHLVMALVAASVALSIPAAAQVRMPQPAPEMDPDMRMPVPGPGGGVKGCWRAKQPLYGQYRLSFCLNRGSDGGYQVDGGKLSCGGDLDWQRNGNQVDIRMNRGRCNRNTDWSRDRISCTIDLYGAAPGEAALIPAQVRMPVPGGGGVSEISRLNCVYRPATGPYGPVRFIAKRDY
ncbi:hypothetical protein DK847_14975 [Aestuariivirga litoralis]|uniref:Uncharacterized protein n=1 Tax=Aestuariivirga litoralis TaxID=2650924 RepID=A0A2W2AKB5_9HYPH|nr:hypothetical protein [Aestuariivirga litoralis]PZF75955.1 hypothetical protein DK847_14975 [Aestuariivirga litoralis]